MAVPFQELEGSGSGVVSQSGNERVRILKVAWEDLDLLEQELLGAVFISGIGIVYTGFATFPGAPWLVLDSLKIDPFDDKNPNLNANGTITYPGGAKVTLNYKTGDEAGGGNSLDPGLPQFVSVNLDISGEVMTTPDSSVRWLTEVAFNSSVPADLNPGKIIPTSEMSMTWKHVPQLVIAQIRAARGHVNRFTFFGAPPETVLFLGASAKRDFSFTGDQAWELVLRFQEKSIFQETAGGQLFGPFGWNHFYRSGVDEPNWHYLVSKRSDGSAGSKMYPTKDLYSLFQFT